MNEFKVVKANHPHSLLNDKEAYAIVTSPVIIADSDAIKGAYCADEENMYVIAESFDEAADLLNQWIYL